MGAPVITTLLSAGSGTTTTDGTEQELSAATAAGGVYQLDVDCTNMVDGDSVTFKIYKKALSSGTRRLFESYSISDGGKGVISFGPFPTAGDIRFTIQRTAGTDRAYPWGILNFTGA